MAFADLEEVEDRLDFALDESMTKMALAALDDASVMACEYARVNWPDDAVPRFVKQMVLNVVARYLRNPDGFTTSRAGDETVSWSDLRGAATLRFTDEERADLAAILMGSPSFGSVGVYAHRPRGSVSASEFYGVTGNPERYAMPLFDPNGYYPYNSGKNRW